MRNCITLLSYFEHRNIMMWDLNTIWWTHSHERWANRWNKYKDRWIKRDQLDVTCFIFSLYTAQHVSDVNTSILRSLQLIWWVIQNRGHFTSNSSFHNINTRQENDMRLPQVSLTMYQKGVLYSSIKVFNALPMTVKSISSNPKQFKVTLKNYLLSHSYYNLDEFFSVQNA